MTEEKPPENESPDENEERSEDRQPDSEEKEDWRFRDTPPPPPKSDSGFNKETFKEEPTPVSAAAGRKKKKAKTYDVARFPKGFWKKADYLLQHPNEILESLKRESDLMELSRIFFMVTLVMSVIYGACMGATNLLQGSPMPLDAKFLMILVTAIKVPFLFLLTFVIVLPPIYVSNAFMGARLSASVVLTKMLAALAVTSTVLASMATVAVFFSLTSYTYDFIKLLHVLFFAYAGIMGIVILARFVTQISISQGRMTPAVLFVIWLMLYGFVGTELGWVLRPFVGSPERPFELFRPREGNFYESVAASMGSVIKD